MPDRSRKKLRELVVGTLLECRETVFRSAKIKNDRTADSDKGMR
jgi:hypothetical protein